MGPIWHQDLNVTSTSVPRQGFCCAQSSGFRMFPTSGRSGILLAQGCSHNFPSSSVFVVSSTTFLCQYIFILGINVQVQSKWSPLSWQFSCTDAEVWCCRSLSTGSGTLLNKDCPVAEGEYLTWGMSSSWPALLWLLRPLYWKCGNRGML